MAEAVIPDLVEGDDIGLQDLAANKGAQLAIHRLPNAGIVAKGEADAVDGGGRYQRGQDQPGEVEELDRAGAQLAQRIGIRPKLVGRKHLDFHLPASFRLDFLHRFLRAKIHRMAGRLILRPFVGPLRGIGAGGAQQSGGGQSAGEQGSAVHHGFHPFIAV